jgi:hypothetical protein
MAIRRIRRRPRPSSPHCTTPSSRPDPASQPHPQPVCLKWIVAETRPRENSSGEDFSANRHAHYWDFDTFIGTAMSNGVRVRTKRIVVIVGNHSGDTLVTAYPVPDTDPLPPLITPHPCYRCV